jgi:hypothetical protein
LGAYRTVTREAAKIRWFTGVPEDKKATLMPNGWFDAAMDASFATDAAGAKQSPPVLISSSLHEYQETPIRE